MRLSLAQLEAFYWIARLGGVRPAARRLNLTQPTLSLRLRELERGLDARLFERAGQRLRLTNHGAAILRHAEHVLTLAGEIEQYARGTTTQQRLLRIGATDIFAHTCLTALLGVLETRYPRLSVALSVAFSHSLNEMLVAGALDVAFLTRPALPQGMRSEPLGNVEIGWMAARSLGLGDRVLRPRDIASRQILTNPAPSHLYQSVHEWFAADGAWPDRVSTCNTLSIIARLAASGFGIALLPVAMPSWDAEAGVLARLRTEPAMPPHALHAACRAEADPEVAAVIAEARRILDREHVLAPI